MGLQQKQLPNNSAPHQPPDPSSLTPSLRRHRNRLPLSPPLLTLTWAASSAGPWPQPVAHSCSGPWRWQLPRLEDSSLAAQDPTDRRTSAHPDPWDRGKPGIWGSLGALGAWSPLQLAVGMACTCPSLHRTSVLTQGSSSVVYTTQPST